MQKLQCWNVPGVLRLIQSIPSPKAEPFKRWLAKVGHERLQEIADPALALERTREHWRKLGRSEKWITQRMTGQETRNKLTDYWASHEIKQGEEFAILTNIIVRVKQAKQFSNGLETGSIIREYSEDELEARDISVNSEGQRDVHKLLVDEQVSIAASRIQFDETLEEGAKGTKNYDTCKFSDTGQRTECFIPVQDARYVMKYDENGRETDWLVYTGDVLHGKTQFTYEENEYGDWTVQHATFWNSTKSDLGFIPLGETYRSISYFGPNSR